MLSPLALSLSVYVIVVFFNFNVGAYMFVSLISRNYV